MQNCIYSVQKFCIQLLFILIVSVDCRDTIGPVRWSELWLKLTEKHCSGWIVVRKKTLFQLEKQAEQAKKQAKRTGPSSVISSNNI